MKAHILYDCPTGYKSFPTPPHHIPLPKQWMVSGTHALHAFSSDSYARPDCPSSHTLICPRIRHDYAKLHVQACSCYAGLDNSFSNCKDKCGVFCKLSCLSSSPVCWRRWHVPTSPSTLRGRTAFWLAQCTRSKHRHMTLTYKWDCYHNSKVHSTLADKIE